MAARVNYEDNIFFLSAIIKTLSTGMSLDIDSEIFREKVVEDIAFVHSTITRLHDSLRNNVYLIRRTEYMRELSRAVQLFIKFLEKVEEPGTSFRDAVAENEATFRRYRDEQTRMERELTRALRSTPKNTEEQEDIIGQDEYRFLFEDGDEG
ncbi:MAG: hypothetical protein ACLFM0_00270 [Spirochaetales bacterium]